jgi:hypothetical protein
LYVSKSEKERILCYTLPLNKSIYTLRVEDIYDQIMTNDDLDIDVSFYASGTYIINDIFYKWGFERRFDRSCDIYRFLEEIKSLICKSDNDDLKVRTLLVMGEYEKVYLKYANLQKLEEELEQRLKILAGQSARLEYKYACFLDCGEKHDDAGLKFLYFDDDCGIFFLN